MSVSRLNVALCFAMESYNSCYTDTVRFRLVTGYPFWTRNNTVPSRIPCVPVSFTQVLGQFLVRVTVSCACASFLYICLSLALSGNHSTLHFIYLDSFVKTFLPRSTKFETGFKSTSFRDKIDINIKPSWLLDPILWCFTPKWFIKSAVTRLMSCER